MSTAFAFATVVAVLTIVALGWACARFGAIVQRERRERDPRR